MARTVNISDELAALLEARRKKAGYTTLDATAESLIAHGLAADDGDGDHSAGYVDEQLRTLIDEAESSGPAAAWDAVAVKAEILRRYAARRRA